MFKKIIATLCATLMVGGTCLALTGCGKKGGANDFTVWIPQMDDSSYYTDYADNPVVKYLCAKEWGKDKDKLSLEWLVPAGDAKEHIVNLFATETYPEIVDASSITNAMPINQMYDEGYILDLTEYVDKYMPNYKAFLAANPALAKTATNTVNGQKKYLQLWCYQGEEQMWGGWNYRRDWLVKYGSNPSTNQAFAQVGQKVTVDGVEHTVGWEGTNIDGTNDKWFDNVYFPSWYNLDAAGNAIPQLGGKEFKDWYTEEIDPAWDGQVPVTIEDWEWMLEIFKSALADLNVSATDGYAMQLYSAGYFELGDMITSFGGKGGTWSSDKDKTTASFGLTDESFRLYINWINKMYKAGYVDQNFATKTGLFYQIDETLIARGNVGLWYGYNSALNDKLEKTGSLQFNTKGIVVYAARQPINATYGTDDYRWKRPEVMFQTNREMRSFIITDKAKGKNLEALFAMMDYMYSEDGTRLNSYGLSKAEYEEYKQLTGKTDKYMEQLNGELYTIHDDGLIEYVPQVNPSPSLQEVLRGSRLFGNQNKYALGYTAPDDQVTANKSMDEYVFYRNTGEITKSMLSQLTIDDVNTFSGIQTKLRNYASQTVPTYVKSGMTDITWRAWRADLKNTYEVDKATEIIQKLLDSLN